MNNKILKKVFGLCLMVVTLCFLTTFEVHADVSVEYGYSEGVQVGVLRYIQQNPGNYYYEAYWGKWADESIRECGTSCISMALSTIGVNMSPQAILDAHNGKTYFTGWGYDTQVSSVLSAMKNYETGNGRYSPVIIHLPKFSKAGHYLVVISKLSDTEYIAINPWNGSSEPLVNIKIDGSNAEYNGITDYIDQVFQYYKEDAIIHKCVFNPETELCECGKQFQPEIIDYKGTAKIKVNVYIKSKPYSQYGVKGKKLLKGAKVKVLNSRTNVYGNTWYLVTSGVWKGYVHEDKLNLSGVKKVIPETEINIDLSWPSEGCNLEKKAQSINGSIKTTGTSLTEVVAYLDGSLLANDSSNTANLNLKGSKIDWAIPFSSMADGSHILKIVATDNTGKKVELERHFNVGNNVEEDKLVVNVPEFNVNVTWPNEGAQVKRASQSLVGQVTVSSGSLNQVDMYLDGKWMTKMTGVSASSINLKGSTFDMKLPFGSLSEGDHWLQFVITDAAGGSHYFVRNFTTVR